ncbi:hypothetical protein WJX79_007767 [Trebouxia sp. C0005]
MVSSDTYSFTASEVQAKQSEIKAQHRVKRLIQRLSDTMAAESARGHALAQQHRAVQAEAEAHTSAPAVPPWSQAALRNIDYKNTRLHELGGAVLVERNGDKDKNTCNEAAETAAELQIRMAQAAEHRRRIAVDQHAASQARGQTAANQDRLQFKAQQTQIQLEAAQQAQRAQQIKALDAKPPPSLGMRCDGLHAQQQLQRHFEAQFLHKPKDFKAKLLNQQQQQQTRTGSSNAGLHWMACMPAARLQKEPVTHPSGKGKPEAQRDTELEHRRQVPMPTKRQPSLVAGGVKGKAIQSRYQLGESQPCLQEDTSAEDALAEELQEAIAEARSHQSMAAQQRKPQPHYQAHPDAVHHSGAVPAAKASDLPLAPVDWKLPYTAELHDQTAALLSSLTTSVDWDLSAADAQLHRQLDAADKSGPGLASAAMPASDLASITSLSEFSTLPGINSMEAVAAVDRVRQGQGRAARAAGRHSPSSYASSGLLSSRSQHSGTGTLKQSKGHGLSSTDIPSKTGSRKGSHRAGHATVRSQSDHSFSHQLTNNFPASFLPTVVFPIFFIIACREQRRLSWSGSHSWESGS